MGRKHLDRAIALCINQPSIILWQRDLVPDIGTSILSYRSIALWLLGYPEAALADTDRALDAARRPEQR